MLESLPKFHTQWNARLVNFTSSPNCFRHISFQLSYLSYVPRLRKVKLKIPAAFSVPAASLVRMASKTNRALFAGGALLMAAAAYGFARGGTSDLVTVPSVDLDRYLGKWYEIARYPNRFQSNASATPARPTRLRMTGRSLS